MSGGVEHDKCDFCQIEKPIERTYLRPSKFKKPFKIEDRSHLFNQGEYFIIIKTCSDCGVPK